jgi:hypothetical protein
MSVSVSKVPRTIVDRSLKLARAPIDAALSVTGASESPAKHLVDRLEAGARSASGVLLADRELKEQGRAVLLATRQRERASSLHGEAELRRDEADRNLEEAAEETAEERAEARRKAEAKRREAEKRRREREERAKKAAAAKKEKVAKAAKKAEQTNAKRDQAAKLRKLDAKEESIERREEAAAAEREAERIGKVAAAAKQDRKDDSGAGEDGR